MTAPTTTELPTLPALRHLADLADRKPVVVVDTREQDPLPIERLPVVRAGLFTGDYSVAGLESVFAIERKSIADLTGCCTQANRVRFEHELHRLRGFRFKRLLIVGTRGEVEAGAYRSRIKPAAVLGSLAAWEIVFDCPVVFEPDPASAARRVESWAWYAAREHVKRCNALLRGTKHEGEATP